MQDDVGQQRQRLLWRIHRRFKTIAEPIQVGPLALDFTRIADPNRVLDEVAAAEDRRERQTGQRRPGDQLHLPYWAELWDSARGMGQVLVKWRGEGSGFRAQNSVPPSPLPGTPGEGPPVLTPNPSLLTPSILDLGCGMGFAGTVAARLGAAVLFADLEAPALLFARLNSLPDAPRIRTRRLNWKSDQLAERFDLILGADILYERTQWEYLERFWRNHLAVGGRVLLGEPGRQTGDLFMPWIQSYGWKLASHEEPVNTRSRPIRLFVLTR